MEHNEKTLKRIERARVPKRFWGKTLDDYRTGEDVGDEQARDAVRDWLDDFEDNLAAGLGFTLIGPPGAGKTLLAAIALQYAIYQKKRGLFQTLASYIRMVQRRIEFSDLSRLNALSPEESDEYFDIRRSIHNAINVFDVMVLDDVGKEHLTSTQWALREFDYLVRHRYDRGLVTIITTNIPAPDWADQYGEAMASFIWEACPPLAVAPSKDFRRRR